MKDRIPTYPGRVTLTPISGIANTYDLTRADQPTESGTPINKANLLSDATAMHLELTQENPTVDNALHSLKDDCNSLGEEIVAVDNRVSDAFEKMPNRNLLDNWDFKNPVDQKQALILPVGKYLYNSSQSPLEEPTTTAYYVTAKNNNLGASYYRIAAGATSYYARTVDVVRGYIAEASRTSAIDRWTIETEGLTLTVHDGFITLTNAGTNIAYFRQYLENPGLYNGKPLIFSADVKEYTGTVNMLIYSTAGSSANVAVSSTGINTVAEDDFIFGSSFQAVISVAGGASISLYTAKLELGEISTLANDPPANYSLEKLIAQWYFQVFEFLAYANVNKYEHRPSMRDIESGVSPTTGAIDIGGVTYYYRSCEL